MSCSGDFADREGVIIMTLTGIEHLGDKALSERTRKYISAETKRVVGNRFRLHRKGHGGKSQRTPAQLSEKPLDNAIKTHGPRFYLGTDRHL